MKYALDGQDGCLRSCHEKTWEKDPVDIREYSIEEIEIKPRADKLYSGERREENPFAYLAEDYRAFRDVYQAHCGGLGRNAQEDRDWALLSGIFQERRFIDRRKGIVLTSKLSRSSAVTTAKELEKRRDFFAEDSEQYKALDAALEIRKKEEKLYAPLAKTERPHSKLLQVTGNPTSIKRAIASTELSLKNTTDSDLKELRQGFSIDAEYSFENYSSIYFLHRDSEIFLDFERLVDDVLQGAIEKDGVKNVQERVFTALTKANSLQVYIKQNPALFFTQCEKLKDKLEGDPPLSPTEVLFYDELLRLCENHLDVFMQDPNTVSKNGTPSSIFETPIVGLQEKCKANLEALKALRAALKEKVADPKEIEKAMNPVDFVHYQCMYLLHMMNQGPLEEGSAVDMMKVWLKMNEHSIYSPLPYFKNPIQEWVLRELYPSMTEGKCLEILSQGGLEWKQKEGVSGVWVTTTGAPPEEVNFLTGRSTLAKEVSSKTKIQLGTPAILKSPAIVSTFGKHERLEVTYLSETSFECEYAGVNYSIQQKGKEVLLSFKQGEKTYSWKKYEGRDKGKAQGTYEKLLGKWGYWEDSSGEKLMRMHPLNEEGVPLPSNLHIKEKREPSFLKIKPLLY